MPKELLFRITKDDLNLTYFSGKGGGGQHRNRHMNCVRLNHKDSGTMVTGQSHRERKSNIKEALNNLVKSSTFKIWHARRVAEINRKETIEQKVDRLMDDKYLDIVYG